MMRSGQEQSGLMGKNRLFVEKAMRINKKNDIFAQNINKQDYNTLNSRFYETQVFSLDGSSLTSCSGIHRLHGWGK